MNKTECEKQSWRVKNKREDYGESCVKEGGKVREKEDNFNLVRPSSEFSYHKTYIPTLVDMLNYFIKKQKKTCKSVTNEGQNIISY